MSFTGKQLVVDPKTGFLEMGATLGVCAFDSKKKIRFLKLARQSWPNIGRICKAVGIDRQTYYNHVKADPKFRTAVEEVRESVLDDSESVNVEEAKGKGGFLPRISTLKAYRPDLYNPARKIIVEGYTMSTAEAERRAKILDTCVDAQIVNAYTTRKERAQAKREGLSLLPSYDSEGGGEGSNAKA